MSIHAQETVRRISVPDIAARKGGEPIVCLTAYDAPMAALLDPHCDVLLVGDSLGMAVHGLPNTVGVTLEMMILHGQAVVRGSRRALVVVDMPFGAYEGGEQVAYEDIAKGYETEDGRMVVLTDEDLKELPVRSSKEITVEKFVPREQIDPIYFDKTYYLQPDQSAMKAYVLLRDALEGEDRMAVATVAIRTRMTLAGQPALVEDLTLDAESCLLPGMLAQLKVACGGTVSVLGMDDVVDQVHTAYNPAVAPAVETARLAGEGTGLTWGEVGPTNAKLTPGGGSTLGTSRSLGRCTSPRPRTSVRPAWQGCFRPMGYSSRSG